MTEYEYGNGQKLDAYFPEATGFTTIVYFHGGSLTGGDKRGGAIPEFAAEFTRLGYGFVSANYRLYTAGAKFPDFIDDCAAAVAYAKSLALNSGGNGEIIVVGQSAGAWLSLMLCLDGKYLAAHGITPSEIKGWIIDSAQTTSHFTVINRELGEDERRQLIDEYAPLYYVRDGVRVGKMLTIYYENDMPCRPEQNLLFAAAVRAFNPGADIETVCLPGGHCHGSSEKDADGRYGFMKVAEKWLKEKF